MEKYVAVTKMNLTSYDENMKVRDRLILEIGEPIFVDGKDCLDHEDTLYPDMAWKVKSIAKHKPHWIAKED